MSATITVHPKRCKSCGICVAFCPKSVLDLKAVGPAKVARPEDCITCQLCELRCPDFALEVKKHEQ